MSTDAPIELANTAFYQAFLVRDLTAMDRLWAQHLPVLCIHPGAAPLATRAQILASWHDILTNPRAPVLEHRIGDILPFGEITLVTCYEWSRAQPDAALVATNGFALEDGAYRMVLHHASPVHHAAARTAMTPKPRIH